MSVGAIFAILECVSDSEASDGGVSHAHDYAAFSFWNLSLRNESLRKYKPLEIHWGKPED
jgi:hypothetical protein